MTDLNIEQYNVAMQRLRVVQCHVNRCYEEKLPKKPTPYTQWILKELKDIELLFAIAVMERFKND